MTRVTSSDDVTIIQRHNVIRNVINVILLHSWLCPCAW